MPQFITRVELHDATWQNYQTLHAAMEAENFSRTIQGSDESCYHLPTAEYVARAETSLHRMFVRLQKERRQRRISRFQFSLPRHITSSGTH